MNGKGTRCFPTARPHSRTSRSRLSDTETESGVDNEPTKPNEASNDEGFGGRTFLYGSQSRIFIFVPSLLNSPACPFPRSDCLFVCPRCRLSNHNATPRKVSTRRPFNAPTHHSPRFESTLSPPIRHAALVLQHRFAAARALRRERPDLPPPTNQIEFVGKAPSSGLLRG